MLYIVPSNISRNNNNNVSVGLFTWNTHIISYIVKCLKAWNIDITCHRVPSNMSKNECCEQVSADLDRAAANMPAAA